MQKKLAALLFAIVLVAVGGLAWLGARIAHDEQAMAEHGFRTLLDDRLTELRGTVMRSLEDLQRDFDERLRVDLANREALRALERTEPLFRQVFVMSPKGQLVFPPLDSSTSADERDFLLRTAPIWSGDAILYAPPSAESQAPSPAPVTSTQRGDSVLDLAARSPSGWIAWHWKEGLHLIYWRRAEGGGVVGAEVERVALVSRLVARLPSSGLADGRIVLTGARGEAIHQWGPYEAKADERALATSPLAPPFDAWQLSYFASGAQREAFVGSSLSSLWPSIGALALALVGLAVYFHRESSRGLREAAQRVGFVTRVSHELKTPLANIRLYSELLSEALPDDDPRASERLQVIVEESQRLGRLIDNVLTFSRHERGQVELHPRSVDAGDAIRSVIHQFEPALIAKGVRTELELSPSSVWVDPDALGQILANLVSNVEKYGASGGVLRVESQDEGERLRIVVADEGPGVPRGHQHLVFDPFHRVSHLLADGVTGTGIGLTIARDLARGCGGELVLADCPRGARFELTLPKPAEENA